MTTVFLHVGAPKTGTTYLQDRLDANQRALARNDVLVPAKHRLGQPSIFAFQASLDLLGQDWGGPAGHAEGAWPLMVRKVRRTTGTAIISHEILATAPGEVVERVMDDFRGCDLHIVYTARDLGRQLPAGWQESIKQGRSWRFGRFLDAAENGRAWFMKAFDLPSVLGTWSRNLPPENVHLITVPQPGGAPDELWRRFCETVRIDPTWAPRESERVNESLGIAETELLRRLNREIGRKTRREADYDQLIRQLLEDSELGVRRSRRVRLPRERFPWADEQAERWIDWATGSGIHIVGDVEELRPVHPDPDEPWPDPDQVSAKRLARAAVSALGVMTAEAASRRDPSAHLLGRLRERRERQRPS